MDFVDSNISPNISALVEALVLFIPIMLVLWAAAFINCLLRPYNDFPTPEPTTKLIWVIVLLFTGIFGVVVYYFEIYRRRWPTAIEVSVFIACVILVIAIKPSDMISKIEFSRLDLVNAKGQLKIGATEVVVPGNAINARIRASAESQGRSMAIALYRGNENDALAKDITATKPLMVYLESPELESSSRYKIIAVVNGKPANSTLTGQYILIYDERVYFWEFWK